MSAHGAACHCAAARSLRTHVCMAGGAWQVVHTHAGQADSSLRSLSLRPPRRPPARWQAARSIEQDWGRKEVKGGGERGLLLCGCAKGETQTRRNLPPTVLRSTQRCFPVPVRPGTEHAHLLLVCPSLLVSSLVGQCGPVMGPWGERHDRARRTARTDFAPNSPNG